MNKLTYRNPVLRFKQGRKILKCGLGDWVRSGLKTAKKYLFETPVEAPHVAFQRLISKGLNMVGIEDNVPSVSSLLNANNTSRSARQTTTNITSRPARLATTNNYWNDRFKTGIESLTDGLRQYLANLGIDFTSAETLLNGLNAQGANLNVDNKFGILTESALINLLSKIPKPILNTASLTSLLYPTIELSKTQAQRIYENAYRNAQAYSNAVKHNMWNHASTNNTGTNFYTNHLINKYGFLRNK